MHLAMWRTCEDFKTSIRMGKENDQTVSWHPKTKSLCVSGVLWHTHTCLRARWRVRDTLTSEAHSHLGVTWQQLKSILTSRKLHRWRTDENVRTASWCCYVAETAEVFSNRTQQLASDCCSVCICAQVCVCTCWATWKDWRRSASA